MVVNTQNNNNNNNSPKLFVKSLHKKPKTTPLNKNIGSNNKISIKGKERGRREEGERRQGRKERGRREEGGRKER